MKIKLFLIIFIFAVESLFAGVSADIFFSSDNGKTWSSDFPVIKKNSKLKVRISYIVDEPRKIKDNVITVGLSSNVDFGSCNEFAPEKKFAQRLPVYWAGAFSPSAFVYDMDFSPRPESTVGTIYNEKTRKRQKANLSACKALEAGSYIFKVSIGCHVQGGERVHDDQSFYVTIFE